MTQETEHGVGAPGVIGPADIEPPLTVTEHLRFHLLQQAGLIKPPPPKYTSEDIDRLYRTEWLPWFEKAMHDRLVMGALRYGTFREHRINRPKRDVIPSCIKRLEEYLKDGNIEHLVDAANLSMVEANCPCHPEAHFGAQDEHDFHVKEMKTTR